MIHITPTDEFFQPLADWMNRHDIALPGTREQFVQAVQEVYDVDVRIGEDGEDYFVPRR